MIHWQLDTRCKTILELLISREDYISIQEIGKILNISKRSVYYDLSKMNDWLNMQHISEIQIERNKGIYLTSITRQKIRELINNVSQSSYYTLSPKERTRLMICSLLGSAKPLFIEQLCLICDISRNTAFNDLKVVRQKMERYGLQLNFESHVGYKVDGSLIKQRALFLYYFQPLIDLIANKQISSINELSFYNETIIKEYLRRLKVIEEKLNTTYVDGMLLSLATLIHIILMRKDNIVFEEIGVDEVVSTEEFQLVTQLLNELPLSEQVYIAMHLLGSRVQVPTIKPQSIDTYSLAEKLVLEFERLACVVFEDKNQLIKLLSYHLNMSIYRYRYGIQIGNPLMSEIQSSYPDLFDITRKACKSLRHSLGTPIPDSEIAYITMHFGGSLRKKNYGNAKCRVLIVCPNGISTANMLRVEVESLHTDIEITAMIPVREVENYYDKSDLIITTVDMDCPIPVVRVNPVISEEDRVRILSKVVQKISRNITNNITLEKVFRIVREYVHPQNHDKLKHDLYKAFQGVPMQAYKSTSSIRLMDVTMTSRIQYKKSVQDWKEAIREASNPLLFEEIIEPGYIEAMIANVEKYGPYIVIAPKLALGHALPQDGVNSLGLSLLCLEEPVSFFHIPVYIIFILAPIDKSSHLGIMRDMMELFADEENTDKFLEKRNAQEILAFIKDHIKQEAIIPYED
ncbi:transcriptional antiterminator/mannitol/fructose-specific phosphotransferase system IIA component (Ntr-type) [Anaerosolibacter carboniphilus]|uniref:Transcriptional antiterminator/mannitol/fructose-specific phosphotransferase system IIA component (Ntr-type) n=1 Tax=Anaerosolibacter carboniphilus TaxID=1417629 RepID=A0A841KPK0_9FIRM|nr:BglG family transcription antiterminator [Anaerosolibacter carboniphilus]MBB6215367.1 transcriptional antiterminator/mannitol/fructose-specific phosphotransferase system IIA component (Ntr-type) [Anaerosolibacter carboniphilus]